VPTHPKHTDVKAAKSKYIRVPGRDFHSAKEKEIRTAREGAKSKHPENKRRV
jgi:hypothetical protein